MSQYIKWFNELWINDITEVGGKYASLGEMNQNLTAEGVRYCGKLCCEIMVAS